MNSFNHYAYGAIGEWLYRVVAGIEIDPNIPGYKHILIQPHQGGEINEARADLQSMYGKISSSWTLDNGKINLRLEIPANTTATVFLPGAKLDEVEEDGKKLKDVKTVANASQLGKLVRLQTGSGTYSFEYKMNAK